MQVKKVIAIVLASMFLVGCQSQHSDKAAIEPPYIDTTLSQRTPIFIDSDMGIGDFYALGYVPTCDQLVLKGISVSYGNVSLEQAALNALSIAQLYNFSCPISLGDMHPLYKKSISFDANADGENGIGNIVLPPA